MAWNEPGNSNNNDNDKDKNRNQDPWGKPPKNNGGNEGPPDLDEALRKVKDTLGKFLGGKKSSNNSGGNHNNNGSFGLPILPIALIIIIGIVGVWLSKAVYIVDQQEQAIILRFGKYYETVNPGLHIYFPPIEQKFQENVTAERSYNKQGQMLTSDENIVDIPVTVQYRITNLKDFILENNNPIESLENATDSALRQVAGSTTMDDILTSGREKMAVEIQEELTSMLDKYQTGIQVTQVNIQSATAPYAVQSAFDDVIRAREEQQKLKNEAETYKNGIVPDARGEAARIAASAVGYREAIVDEASGNAIRFEKLLSAYQQAPQITRDRMYLDTIQEVLSKTSKVLITGKDGQNQVIYLPLDKLMNNQKILPTTSGNLTKPSTNMTRQQTTLPTNNTADSRARGER
ncbi:FtsH protease activity modulator HflK [Gammaproteobacteria bacterium ESL0073]|nr:FtsH protease activity modulator HflK [Gammaproteobacteria bacterium ESL0073]